MSIGSISTSPKPFIFVLMPFDSDFDDIYKFGIKGAADDAGAYAERLDEQIFTEGMLDRIFNQISKADVIVADMTGRNPNVFYEVGYAHALGKIVVLLTQKKEDIPFDLMHRQHIVYSGSIDLLRKELGPRLQWAITQSRQQLRPGGAEQFLIRVTDENIPRSGDGGEPPLVIGIVDSNDFNVPLQLKNASIETILGITHVYLFCQADSSLVPCEYRPEYEIPGHSWIASTRNVAHPLESFQAHPADSTDNLVQQFRLPITFPALPPGAVEMAYIAMMFINGATKYHGAFRLRLHSPSQFHDFSFQLQLELKPSEKNEQQPTK
ncbi:MAG: hypothetical protein AB1540_17880 [Bdellovibrionota bacterium]